MADTISIYFMHDAFMEVLSRKRPMNSNEVAKILLEAKEMHKKEIEQAWYDGMTKPGIASFCFDAAKMEAASKYYDNKYVDPQNT